MIAIIGGGIAGLSAGIRLLQRGSKDVVIFEKHHKTGGLCTNWQRSSGQAAFNFNGCMHWLLGAGKGIFEQEGRESSWHRMWNSLIDIDNLQFVYHTVRLQMQTENANALGERTFKLYANADELLKHLTDGAPEDEKIFHEFHKLVKTVSLNQDLFPPHYDASTSTRIAQRLKFAGLLHIMPTLLKYSRLKNTDFARMLKNTWAKEIFTRLYTNPIPMVAVAFACAYADSRTAGYPVGGSETLTSALTEQFLQLGGTLKCNTTVEKINIKNNKVCSVTIQNGQTLNCEAVISAADWFWTINSALADLHLPTQVPTSDEVFYSFISINMVTSAPMDQMPHFERILTSKPVMSGCGTHYNELEIDVYNYDTTLTPQGYTALNVNLICRNRQWWIDLRQTDIKQYNEQKQTLASQVIEELSLHYGTDFKSSILCLNIATPATYLRYTGNTLGSVQGFMPHTKVWKGKNKKLLKHLNRLEGFAVCGHWTVAGGGLPIAMYTALKAADRIAKGQYK